jgi:hypothetical protein
MAFPYETQQLKQSFFCRILGREPKENAIIKITNLFAQAENLTDVSSGDIQNIFKEHNIDLHKNFPDQMRNFYWQYLKYCLSDNKITEEDRNTLYHLGEIMNLSESEAIDIYSKEVTPIYQDGIDAVIANGCLNEAGKSALKKLRTDLILSEESAKDIYAREVKKYMEDYISSILSTGAYSPEDEIKLNQLATNLGAQIGFDSKTRDLLDKYRLNWIIENGDIPEKQTDINLHKDEKCYFSTNVKWYEHKTITQRVRYSGPTARIKIFKGFYYRMGDLAVQRITQDILAFIDFGSMYLTNKRLIIMGGKKSLTIPLSKILNFTPYTNGIKIEKETGTPPFFEFTNEVDIFANMLKRVLHDFNK